MDKIEVTGRTIEEAIDTAALQLGVGADEIDYEIVEEGSKGFLGLGQSPTVIKAAAKPGVESRPRPQPAPEPVAETEEEVEEPVEAEPAPTMAKATEQSTGGDEFTRLVVSILADVLKAMDLDAKPVVRSDDDEEVVVEMVGQDLAILIGKRGQTLDALQYIIGIGANKGGIGGRKRVILDAEGYRERHREMLEQRALDYARAVKQQGEEAVLEPQPARDRRVIHMALKEHPDVYTYSEGEGEDRHVVISPKK